MNGPCGRCGCSDLKHDGHGDSCAFCECDGYVQQHTLALYFDNVVNAWVLICECGRLTNDNYGPSIADIGQRADWHLAAVRTEGNA